MSEAEPVLVKPGELTKQRRARQRHMRMRREANTTRYVERRAWLDTIKLASGCVDCGYNAHPAALDFDHRDHQAKSFGIAANLARRLEVLEAEIAKCDVRCANCHRIKSASEGRGGRPRHPEA